MALTLRESFNPRANSIGFLRWLMAFVVIFSHAGPLGGFYGGIDLGTQWSSEQSFGGVAVAGFFFLSGFLITKSRQGRSTIFRYFWRRFLRIFPAFWASLVLTACVLAPLAWRHVHGTFSGFWSAPDAPPLGYITENFFLRLQQRTIAGLGGTTPLGSRGGFEWNGSASTLIYEFKGYILIGVLGLFGMLGYRKLAAGVFAFILLMNTMMWGFFGNFTVIEPLMRDLKNVMYLTPFFFGMIFALFDDKVRIDDRIALAAAGVAFFTYFIASGWNFYGQFGFLYVLIWCAVRLPLTNWEKYGDLSYGIYIYAWPLMMLAAYFGLQNKGWLVYHVTIVVACHVLALISWHLLEKRALALKNWTPGWLAAALRWMNPAIDAVRRRIVAPDFSSTHYAKELRHDAAALERERIRDGFVTHDPSQRTH